MITSFTTLLVLICLFLPGGGRVSGFPLALNVSPADLIPPKREEIDSLP